MSDSIEGGRPSSEEFIMWFDSWADLARIVLVGTAAYAGMVLVLRVSGKRTLSQLNAFDFVVTVALGSTLATILLSSDVSFTEGLLAFALLVALQWVIATVAARWPRARGAITSRPRVVVRNGQLDTNLLAASRLAEADVMQAVRASGVGDISLIAAMVLETNGTFSVIQRENYGDGSAMGAMA